VDLRVHNPIRPQTYLVRSDQSPNC
jgi:hypothetical protein